MPNAVHLIAFMMRVPENGFLRIAGGSPSPIARFSSVRFRTTALVERGNVARTLTACALCTLLHTMAEALLTSVFIVGGVGEWHRRARATAFAA